MELVEFLTWKQPFQQENTRNKVEEECFNTNLAEEQFFFVGNRFSRVVIRGRGIVFLEPTVGCRMFG